MNPSPLHKFNAVRLGTAMAVLGAITGSSCVFASVQLPNSHIENERQNSNLEASNEYLEHTVEVSVAPTQAAPVEATHEVEANLDRYINNLEIRGEISQGTAHTARNLWKLISNILPYRTSVPDASCGPNGEFLYTWNKDMHHFEIEVLPTGDIEFFYRDEVSGRLWDADYSLEKAFPQRAKDYLSLFD